MGKRLSCLSLLLSLLVFYDFLVFSLGTTGSIINIENQKQEEEEQQYSSNENNNSNDIMTAFDDFFIERAHVVLPSLESISVIQIISTARRKAKEHNYASTLVNILAVADNNGFIHFFSMWGESLGSYDTDHNIPITQIAYDTINKPILVTVAEDGTMKVHKISLYDKGKRIIGESNFTNSSLDSNPNAKGPDIVRAGGLNESKQTGISIIVEFESSARITNEGQDEENTAKINPQILSVNIVNKYKKEAAIILSDDNGHLSHYHRNGTLIRKINLERSMYSIGQIALSEINDNGNNRNTYLVMGFDNHVKFFNFDKWYFEENLQCFGTTSHIQNLLVYDNQVYAKLVSGRILVFHIIKESQKYTCNLLHSVSSEVVTKIEDNEDDYDKGKDGEVLVDNGSKLYTIPGYLISFNSSFINVYNISSISFSFSSDKHTSPPKPKHLFRKTLNKNKSITNPLVTSSKMEKAALVPIFLSTATKKTSTYKLIIYESILPYSSYKNNNNNEHDQYIPFISYFMNRLPLIACGALFMVFHRYAAKKTRLELRFGRDEDNYDNDDFENEKLSLVNEKKQKLSTFLDNLNLNEKKRR